MKYRWPEPCHNVNEQYGTSIPKMRALRELEVKGETYAYKIQYNENKDMKVETVNNAMYSIQETKMAIDRAIKIHIWQNAIDTDQFATTRLQTCMSLQSEEESSGTRNIKHIKQDKVDPRISHQQAVSDTSKGLNVHATIFLQNNGTKDFMRSSRTTHQRENTNKNSEVKHRKRDNCTNDASQSQL